MVYLSLQMDAKTKSVWFDRLLREAVKATPKRSSSFKADDFTFQKYTVRTPTYLCQLRPKKRFLKVLFNGNLKPTPKNILSEIQSISRSVTYKFSTVILNLFSTTKNRDPRIEWLKKHRKKVFTALLNQRSARLRRSVARFLFRKASNINNSAIESILIEMLSHSDLVIRQSAILSLVSRRNLTQQTIKTLCKRLGHRSSTQADVLEVLARVGNIPNRYAERALIKIARNIRNRYRQLAVQALALLKKKSTRSEKTLVHVLKRDPSATVRAYAAIALGERGVRSRRVLAALTWSVQRDRIIDIAIQAVSAIGKLGNVNASTATKLLIPRITSWNYNMRNAALFALLSAPKKVVAKELTTIVGLLNDPFSDVRAQALTVIAYLKPQDMSVVKKIVPLINYKRSWSIRFSAIFALSNIGRLAKPLTVSALKARLRKEGHPQVKAAINEALEHFARLK